MTKSYGQIRQEKHQKQAMAILSKIDDDIQSIIQAGLGPWPEGELFRKLWPTALMVAIDPIPRYFVSARNLGFCGLEFVNAIWNVSGETLSFSDRRMKTSVFLNLKGRQTQATTITLNDVIAEAKKKDYYRKPNLLWMDCEGAELKALEGADQIIGDIDWIICELNKKPRYDWWPHESLVLDKLKTCGFQLVHRSNDGLFRRI